MVSCAVELQFWPERSALAFSALAHLIRLEPVKTSILDRITTLSRSHISEEGKGQGGLQQGDRSLGIYERSPYYIRVRCGCVVALTLNLQRPLLS